FLVILATPLPAAWPGIVRRQSLLNRLVDRRGLRFRRQPGNLHRRAALGALHRLANSGVRGLDLCGTGGADDGERHAAIPGGVLRVLEKWYQSNTKFQVPR